jgi:hypothetical protein
MDLDWRSDKPDIDALRQTQHCRLPLIPGLCAWLQDCHVDHCWYSHLVQWSCRLDVNLRIM